MMCCLLCYSDMESHGHLFFNCTYSHHVWSLVCDKSNIENKSLTTWVDTASWASSFATSKTLKHIIWKLVLAASVYHIWRERNHRLHNYPPRPPDVFYSAIYEDVRYRLMGLKLKRRHRVALLFPQWDIVNDGG
jgi:hypothetical protein